VQPAPSSTAGFLGVWLASTCTAPERFADSQIPLAPRAPSIHDPLQAWVARFAERDIKEFRGGHSPLMLAALIIGHHRSISAFWNVASPSGVCWSRGKLSCPIAAIRARRLESAITT
jgi:hypothetical protein